jgi:taurine dioxygenase
MGLKVNKLDSALGAEVSGLRLDEPLDAETSAALVAAWRQHLVLVFRGQAIDDAGLLGFAKSLGDLDLAPALDSKKAHVASFPEIAVVSNVIENGEPIGGLGSGDLAWHSDMTFQEEPPVGCVLNARETPISGGYTWFTSLRAATAALPDALREKIAGRKALHDHSYTSAGTLRHGVVPSADPETRPGARHNLIWTHPSWQEDFLLLGRRFNGHVVGLPIEESEALLDALWAHATDPAFAMRHEWQPGDVVLWDNLLTMHRRDAFDSGARRVLHRAQIRRLSPQWRAAA